MTSSMRRAIAGGLFTLAAATFAAVAAWPIYASARFIVLVVVCVVVGAGIAILVAWRRWHGLVATGILAVTVLLLGIPLAVPARLGGPLELLRGLGDVATGVVFGWKDLVTVDLPVGSYRNLLVPALVVFLVGTCLTLLLSAKESRLAYLAVIVAFAMASFGLFFGSAEVSDPIVIGPVTLYAPRETFVGAILLLVALLWLGWRSRQDRVRQLRRAAASSGVRMSGRITSGDRRRIALGVGMIAVSVAVAALVVPLAAQGADREVLRSAAGPDIDPADEVSPLSEYRAQFADARVDDVLFRVTGDRLPDRVRIATLDSYDGEVYRSGGGDSVDQSRFVRVPASLDPGAGTPVEMSITIDALRGIWMPTAGKLVSAEFSGSRSASLTDRFYYSASAEAGVQTAGGGLREGDRYVLRAVEPTTPDLDELRAPGGATDSLQVPQSLRTWVEEHTSGTGGAALRGLVDLLRERGYLSHALSVPEGTTPVWMQKLGDYAFQPSASGHSLARIDQMFTRLLDREADPRAAATGVYVATIGDDEQFAVATALVARELGFPARVVLGARLSSADDSLPVCDAGACTADDLAVWTEVQARSGAWVPIDVTPQYAVSPSLEVVQQRDPENVTEVRPDAVDEVVPPDPVQQDERRDDPVVRDGADLSWLWPILRIGGISLLILLIVFGPLLAIAAAKGVRRRQRRTRGAPAARIAGGWDEYLDAAADAGRDVPASLTRPELAAALATPSAGALARESDRAVFADGSIADGDAERFWDMVDEDRQALTADLGFWRRLRATVSLTSFVRQLTPAPRRRQRQRIAERGTRRAARLAQTTQ